MSSRSINGEYPVNSWASELLSFINGINLPESYVTPAPGELQNIRVRPIATKKEDFYNLFAYPNPANEKVIVSYVLPDGCTGKKIIIRNLDGRIIRETTISGLINQKTVNVKDIKSGVYIIELIGNNISIASCKLEIIH